MDYKALVEEITARVAAKLEAAGEQVAPALQKAAADCGARPRVLVLTADHGTDCHAVYDDEKLREKYDVDCALLNSYDCDAASYEAVVLYGLTVDTLCRLAGGICDTPFSSLARKALMLGKKLYVPEEEVEIYAYAGTAPCAYYQMFLDKIELLKSSGLVICPQLEIVGALLGAERPKTACGQPEKCGSARIDKRLVSERDVAAVYNRSLASIRVGARAIVTDLAREYAAARGVEIIRD